MGLAPKKPSLAGVKLVFIGFSLAYKPIYTYFRWLHNAGRSTVWYAYPKEEWAVILRDLHLFKLGPRPALPRARRGGGAPSAQVTGHLSTPYNREPHASITAVLSPLHPYPENDRLNVANMACILLFVIYGCFKWLGALEVSTL